MRESIHSEPGYDPSRRVPKRLNRSDEIYRGFTLNDFVVIGGIPVVLIVSTTYILPEAARFYGFVLAGIGFLLGMTLVFASPPYLKTTDWLLGYYRFWRRPKTLTHIRYHFDHAQREQRDLPESELFETTARTQDLTYIKRLYPRDGAVERNDGWMYGGVKITPANMALQTPQKWRENANAFTRFLDTSVEFPIQIYATNRPFDTEGFLDAYRRRLLDDDIRGQPIFQALIDRWLEWYPTELELRGTNIREYYLLVSVSPADLQNQTDEGGIIQRIADFPWIGGLVTSFGRTDIPEVERSVELRGLLAERLSLVESNAVRGILGCEARRVSTADLAVLLKEFWEGEAIDEGDVEALIRRRGIVSPDSVDSERLEADHPETTLDREPSSTQQAPADD